jgi:hypothetical protein
MGSWRAEREQQAAETRQKVQDYAKMREELGMANPFPPKDVLAKHEAEARKLRQRAGGQGVFEGAPSAMGPAYLSAEVTQSGRKRCQETTRSLAGSSKEAVIRVNGKAMHRKEAWKLCGDGVNHIKVTRG